MPIPRLIHLLSSNAPDAKGRQTLDILKWFRDKGWSVCAYTRDARAVDTHFRKAGIPRRHLGMMGLSDIYSLRTLISDLRGEERGTVVHAHRIKDAMLALSARFFARRKDIRVVLTVHNSRFSRPPAILKRVLRTLDAVIFTTTEVAANFSRIFPVGEVKGKIIHYTIPSPPYLPIAEPATGPMTAMWHGRMVAGKGLETLIDALPALKGKRIRLRISGYGNPDYVDSLRRRAAALGVMQMIDWTSTTDDIYSQIATAHFGVFPSTDPEAFGFPNIEYMAAGRTQIVTAGKLQQEYLTDGRDSLMIAPGDTEALSQAILSLASDSTTRHALGASARRRYLADMSWERFTQALEEIYTS